MRELDFGEAQAINFIAYLPVKWVNRDVYEKFMVKTEIVRRKSARLALALVIGCDIITANTKDFKPCSGIRQL